MKRRSFVAGIAASVSAFSASRSFAGGKLHVVEMITEDGQKLFSPDLLKVDVGDEVQFINVSGNHNTESVEGMIPDGAEPWLSELRETFTVKITHEGVYGYKCTPHLKNGMVGVIVAGDPTVNLAEARAVKTSRRADELFGILYGLVGK
ncbi:MAG: plastocyanin/azurin family copper-binding protein [Pseudomonadota bacterium]